MLSVVVGFVMFFGGFFLVAAQSYFWGMLLMFGAAPVAILLWNGSPPEIRPGELTPGDSTFKLLFNTKNRKNGTVRISRAWFDQANIRTLDGANFELWVAEGLRRQGWQVEVTPASGDYGADLVATKDGQRTAVQVKQYAKQVGVSAVQQVMGGAAHWKCSAKMVVTSAPDFTPAAKKLAATTGTKLVNGREVERWRSRTQHSSHRSP